MKKKQPKHPFLLKHPKYPKMYYVKFDDGSISESFYNRTWAVEHYRLDQELQKMGVRSLIE